MESKASFKLILLSLLVSAVLIWAGLSIYSRRSANNKISNVLLISIDTCRADHLGCYGSSKRLTPNIDELAKEGILFTNTYTVAPITLPAHCSMLTGTLPPRHGVHDNNDYNLGKSSITMAEIMAQNGFSTAGFISAFVLDSIFGLSQGFDYYDDRFEKNRATMDINERKGEDTTHLALEWLDKHTNQNFFLFLHYYDPHKGYDPPEPFASEFKNNPYAGEIAYVDHCIGKIVRHLKELSLYDSTLVIITADHGEMLGEHGELTHMYFIYESAVKIPLIFKLPGHSKPERIASPAGLVDILPTVCGMLDIGTPDCVQGIDLSIYFHKKKAPVPKRYIYCESLFPTKYNANSLLGVITNRWKYIQTTRPELYDVITDPRETNNLVLQQPQTARRLQKHLKQILENSAEKHHDNTDGKIALGEEEINRLESLGYLASSAVSEDFDFDQTKEDPKDLIKFHVRAMHIYWLISQSKMYSEAKKECEKILQERPGNLTAYFFLARIATEQEEFSEALRYLKKASKGLINENETSLCLKPNLADLNTMLGSLSLRQGELEDAVVYFSKALQINPKDVKVRYSKGMALQHQGKYREAEEEYSKTLQIKSNHTEALISLGDILLKQNKFSQAEDTFSKLLLIEPNNSKARCSLGIALQQQGKIDEALENYYEVLKTDPKDIRALNNIGIVLFTKGKRKEAIANFQKALKINPDFADAHDNLGSALAMEQRLGEAIVHFKEAVRLNPANKISGKNLKTALKNLAVIDASAAEIQIALSNDPDNPTLNCKLGDLYTIKGDFEKATSQYQKALSIQSGFTQALDGLSKINTF